MKVEDYIKQHKHICYCEAIVMDNGDIDDAVPSHIEALIKLTGLGRDKVWELMPITASPIEWLMNYTNTVCLWYQGYMKTGNLTVEQLRTINMLSEKKIIKKNVLSIY